MRKKEITERVRSLKVFKKGARRAPHKPLLLLLAISRLESGQRIIPFAEIEKELRGLLDAYAPPVKSRHGPELPYWHLQNDGLWKVTGGESLPLTRSGFPMMAPLRETSGEIPGEIADQLMNDGHFREEVIQTLLDCHFPESLHDDIRENVQFQAREVADPGQQIVLRKTRDPAFRHKVLEAYKHQCAITGFRAKISGSYFGCEAAHIQWHAHGGPNDVPNGLSLEPTIHKLFDAGAWTLTDDCRLLVSRQFEGNDTAIRRLRSRHGKPIARPLAESDIPSIEFIRWHREPLLGGVFRPPALG